LRKGKRRDISWAKNQLSPRVKKSEGGRRGNFFPQVDSPILANEDKGRREEKRKGGREGVDVLWKRKLCPNTDLRES